MPIIQGYVVKELGTFQQNTAPYIVQYLYFMVLKFPPFRQLPWQFKPPPLTIR